MAEEKLTQKKPVRNVDMLNRTRKKGRYKKGITEEDLKKANITDEILARLQVEKGLSKDSADEIRESIDKALQSYKFEKDESKKTVYERNIDMLEEFLQAKRIENKSPVSLYNYGNEITRLFMNLPDVLYTDITTDDVRSYMNFRKVHDGLSDVSIANIRMYLRSFFGWMKAEEKIDKNPMDRIAPVKKDKKVIDTLSDEEVEIIRCACTCERDLAIVDILSGSGMRVSELCSLNQDDVNLEDGTMKVFGKGSKERICFLTGRAKVHLKWYLAERTDDNPALFITTKKPFTRVTKNGVEYILKEIAKRSGIPKLRLYPHKFRSTLATNFINKGADISIVQRALGHSSPAVTTQSYARIEDTTLQAAHHKYVS